MHWKEQKNLQRLKKVYLKYPLVLYTGAGISFGNDQYGLPGWKNLLIETARIGDAERALSLRHEFEARWPDTWACADWVMKLCDGREEKDKRNKMEEILFDIIQKEHNYRKALKQLSPQLIHFGTTLTSVAAFCCDLGDIVSEAQSKTYVCRANRRIQAIITTNYDPFLEAAATSLFRKKLLKPVAAYGAPAGTHNQIPVFHIHGYVPHPGQEGDKEQQATAPNLVITTKDFKESWRMNTAFGTTPTPQIHYIRHYPTLFIGFSFQDKKVVQLLKKLHKEREYRQERSVELYAIMESSNAKDSGIDFEKLGVNVVELPSFEDIPACLGEIYRAGLKKDFPNGLPEQLQMVSINEYWSTLLSCWNGSPRKKEMERWLSKFLK